MAQKCVLIFTKGKKGRLNLIANTIVYSIFALYRDTKNYTFDYDDMAGYLHYIQLQFSIEPSEGPGGVKKNIFSESKDLDS